MVVLALRGGTVACIAASRAVACTASLWVPSSRRELVLNVLGTALGSGACGIATRTSARACQRPLVAARTASRKAARATRVVLGITLASVEAVVRVVAGRTVGSASVVRPVGSMSSAPCSAVAVLLGLVATVFRSVGVAGLAANEPAGHCCAVAVGLVVLTSFRGLVGAGLTLRDASCRIKRAGSRAGSGHRACRNA